MVSHEIFYRSKSLTGEETVEIINSKQMGNIKVFTGKIITDDQPVIFMIVFKKHLIFNTYMFDKVYASAQYGDYIEIFTSHGFIKYISKLNYDNFDISIKRNPKYSKIIPFVLITLIYIIQRMKMKKQNDIMNK